MICEPVAIGVASLEADDDLTLWLKSIVTISPYGRFKALPGSGREWV